MAPQAFGVGLSRCVTCCIPSWARRFQTSTEDVLRKQQVWCDAVYVTLDQTGLLLMFILCNSAYLSHSCLKLVLLWVQRKRPTMEFSPFSSPSQCKRLRAVAMVVRQCKYVSAATIWPMPTCFNVAANLSRIGLKEHHLVQISL